MLKRFGWRNRLHFLLSPLQESKAFHSLRVALHLLRHGIATPEPVGAFEVRRAGFVQENGYLTLPLGPKLNVKDFLRRISPGEKAGVLLALGRELRRLHESGVFHGDLEQNNIFLRLEEQPRRFYILDLNRARILHQLPNLLRIADLSRLKFGEEDYKRLLHGYARDKREFDRLWKLLAQRLKFNRFLNRLKGYRNRYVYRPLRWRR